MRAFDGFSFSECELWLVPLKQFSAGALPSSGNVCLDDGRNEGWRLGGDLRPASSAQHFHRLAGVAQPNLLSLLQKSRSCSHRNPPSLLY